MLPPYDFGRFHGIKHRRGRDSDRREDARKRSGTRMTKVAEDEKPQIERFRETARAVGVDEEEAAFKAKLAVIARQKPKNRRAPGLEKTRERRAV
jgi:hypothetical protein